MDYPIFSPFTEVRFEQTVTMSNRIKPKMRLVVGKTYMSSYEYFVATGVITMDDAVLIMRRAKTANRNKRSPATA